jgi:hypothetical protein
VLGVRLTCGHRITDLAAERAAGRFDAVFVAVGAHLSRAGTFVPTGPARISLCFTVVNLNIAVLFPANWTITEGLSFR